MMSSPDYARATNRAYQALRKLQITTLPVPMLSAIDCCPDLRVMSYADFCYYNDITRHDLMKLRASEKGFIVRKGRRGLILYNERSDCGIIRFTLAHELGHYLLRHTEENRIADLEANCFARNFICPLPASDCLGLESVNDYCDVFEITAKAAETTIGLRRSDNYRIDPDLYRTTYDLFSLDNLTLDAQLSRYVSTRRTMAERFLKGPVMVVI